MKSTCVCIRKDELWSHTHIHMLIRVVLGNTAHIYPILLFRISKRCQGFETTRMHKGREWRGMSAVTGFQLSTSAAQVSIRTRQFTWRSWATTLFETNEDYGTCACPHEWGHRLPNSSDTDPRNSVPKVENPYCTLACLEVPRAKSTLDNEKSPRMTTYKNFKCFFRLLYRNDCTKNKNANDH